MEVVKKEKSGGRKTGTPNKLNFELRSLISQALATEFEQLPALLAELEPAARVDAMIKLSGFCLPKIVPIDSRTQCDEDRDTARAARKLSAAAKDADMFDDILN